MGRGRDNAKHPLIHRTAPTTNNGLFQSVASVEIEKLCSRTFAFNLYNIQFRRTKTPLVPESDLIYKFGSC